MSTNNGVGPYLNVDLSKKNSRTMKKYIEISSEVLERLQTGKALEGTLKMDLMTRSIKFNAFNRKSREPGYVPPAKILLRPLDFGWLKESATRIMRFESFPKRLGGARIMSLMDAGNQQAKDIMIDREIKEFC